jgi:hypothetical protein
MPSKGAFMSEALPGMIFSEVKGSMTSPDGQTVFLKAETIDGDDLLLGFPQEAIGTIIENLAVQLPNGRDVRGEKVMTAFFATGYEMGKGPNGEPVLVQMMGENAKLNFVLSQEMVGSLVGHLAEVAMKN